MPLRLAAEHQGVLVMKAYAVIIVSAAVFGFAMEARTQADCVRSMGFIGCQNGQVVVRDIYFLNVNAAAVVENMKCTEEK